MAVLSDTERFNVWADFMRDQIVSSYGITKQDLRAAVDAIDAFMDTNETAINLAFPQPARSSLSPAEKAAILMYVTARRYKVQV